MIFIFCILSVIGASLIGLDISLRRQQSPKWAIAFVLLALGALLVLSVGLHGALLGTLLWGACVATLIPVVVIFR